MAASGIYPLDLHGTKRKAGGVVGTLFGADATGFYATSMTHTIHRQAAFGITAELLRHNVRWMRGKKVAAAHLTPGWVVPFVTAAVDPMLALGYFAVKQTGDRLEVAAPCTLDMELQASSGEWVPTERFAKVGWTVHWLDEPYTLPGPNGASAVCYRSPAASAARDTERYDELVERFAQRNFYNSRPSLFATVSRDLKQQNGSTRAWYQTAQAPDGAAMRTPANIDQSFNMLVAARADTIQQLDQSTAVHRERLRGGAKTASAEKYINKDNAHHLEHVVTDGRDATPVRQMLSMTDGEHMLKSAAFDIFFAYRTPPQVLGININAERTSINPRLNELVLEMFIASTSRMRMLVQNAFDAVVVGGGRLTFQTVLTRHDCERLRPYMVPKASAEAHATTFRLPLASFDMEAFREAPPAKGTVLDKALATGETPAT